jgi:hypothetical protein
MYSCAFPSGAAPHGANRLLGVRAARLRAVRPVAERSRPDPAGDSAGSGAAGVFGGAVPRAQGRPRPRHAAAPRAALPQVSLLRAPLRPAPHRGAAGLCPRH